MKGYKTLDEEQTEEKLKEASNYQLINEPIQEVLNRYSINADDARNLVYKGKKGVWWIDGNGSDGTGDMVLKKVSVSEATLRFMIACVRHLTQNGIRIPEILKTKDGQDFVALDKTCFVLSRAVNGKKLNPGNIVDIKAIAAEMGRFHKASIGFACPPGAKQKNHLGTWIEEYQKILEDMNVYYKIQMGKRTRTQTESMIVREFPYFYEKGRTAIDGLRGNEYSEWVRLAHKQGSLCHQDFSTANLIMTSNGIYVLDTDSITIDIFARDLRKLFNKIIKRMGKWDVNLAGEMAIAYNKELSLSMNQLKVTSYDLMFPHLFLGAMDKYVNKRDKTWGEEEYYNRINEMIIFEKSKGLHAGSLGLYRHDNNRR